jgi:malignant T-cell-amplified sequence
MSFKKFSVADDISSQIAIKSSVQRAIKTTIIGQFPAIEPYLDDILPKKGDVLEGKGKDRSTFVIAESTPLFYKSRDGPYLPTLRLLHQYPLMMPRIQVDKGAIKFVLNGSDIMCPGCTSKGGAIPVDLPAGAPVAVYAEGKEHAIAIGTLLMSTDEM